MLIPTVKHIYITLSILTLLLVFAGVVFTQQLDEFTPQPALTEPLHAESSFSAPAQPIRVLFAGDIMLDRHIRTNAEKSGYSPILSKLTPLLSSVDVVIANLEGPVTQYASKSVGSAVGSSNNFLFTFAPESLRLLTENNIRIVNLGNNHILNFGAKGLEQTYNNLEEYGIESFGFTGNTEHATTLVSNIQGVRIGFANYNQFVSNGYERALNDIESLEQSADIIFVLPHWGIEYEAVANRVIQEQAHSFIDAGADAVIGGHPHVIQQREIYAGKTIYYSLGNFIFDQYFEPAVREGLLVEVAIDPVTLELQFAEHRTWLETNGTTRLSADE